MQKTEELDILEGTVEQVTYYSEESGYSVLRLEAEGASDWITVTGKMSEPHPGAHLRFRGNWTKHPKYGQQFQALFSEVVVPATATGLQRYLASGMIKGIGPVTAFQMVETYGTEIVDIIENNPQKLLRIPNIGKKKQEQIIKSWNEHREIQNVMVFLQGHGVSTAYAVKIFKCYGDKAISVVQGNPYQLTEDIWGIGFKIADQLAQNIGLEPESLPRLRAGLLFAMRKSSEQGHVYLPKDDLLRRASGILGVKVDLLPPALSGLQESEHLILENEAVYLRGLYQSEVGVSQRLKALKQEPSQDIDTELEVWLKEQEQELGIDFSPEQAEAIQEAVKHKVFILTGGPGTGKTTISQTIIEWFESQKLDILLASPTGRAAKRLSEVSGKEAKTIHRLLEFDPKSMIFMRDAEDPIECDVLLLDEFSMVDIHLFNHLLKALPPSAHLILVGDQDQLPSVGPGAVLKDLLESGEIPCVTLKTIFRQAQSSLIIRNAHAINQGQMPELLPPIGRHRHLDTFFMAQQQPEQLHQELLRLVGERLPKVGYEPEDIQILVPMNKGSVGVQALNELLQDCLNPFDGQGQLIRKGRRLREGDRIIQLRNNYDQNIYNGDMGKLILIDEDAKEVKVSFPEKDVIYDFSELDEINLAYALSIHKSQGSEFPVVIMPLMPQHHIMLQRNLVYTGMTRARKLLVMMGSQNAI